MPGKEAGRLAAPDHGGPSVDSVLWASSSQSWLHITLPEHLSNHTVVQCGPGSCSEVLA